MYLLWREWWGLETITAPKQTAQLRVEITPNLTHLSVSLHLRVDKGPQDMCGDRQVREDQLGLLMEAEQGEVVPQLHGLDGILLLYDA